MYQAQIRKNWLILLFAGIIAGCNNTMSPGVSSNVSTDSAALVGRWINVSQAETPQGNRQGFLFKIDGTGAICEVTKTKKWIDKEFFNWGLHNGQLHISDKNGGTRISPVTIAFAPDGKSIHWNGQDRLERDVN